MALAKHGPGATVRAILLKTLLQLQQQIAYHVHTSVTVMLSPDGRIDGDMAIYFS